MKLLASLFVSALIGTASATSHASVYVFQGQASPKSSANPPTLSPDDARLIFAQRLGASQYHGLAGVEKETLSYITEFGGSRGGLFEDSAQDVVPELVLIVDGVSSETAEPLLNAWSSIDPSFYISSPPMSGENKRLVQDLSTQIGAKNIGCDLKDAVNPSNERCWNGKAGLIHTDLSKGSKVLFPFSDIYAIANEIL